MFTILMLQGDFLLCQAFLPFSSYSFKLMISIFILIFSYCYALMICSAFSYDFWWALQILVWFFAPHFSYSILHQSSSISFSFFSSYGFKLELSIMFCRCIIFALFSSMSMVYYVPHSSSLFFWALVKLLLIQLLISLCICLMSSILFWLLSLMVYSSSSAFFCLFDFLPPCLVMILVVQVYLFIIFGLLIMAGCFVYLVFYLYSFFFRASNGLFCWYQFLFLIASFYFFSSAVSVLFLPHFLVEPPSLYDFLISFDLLSIFIKLILLF